jgi:hypothetical protein
MRTTTKTTLILTSVLIIGIVIGFFGASSWLHYSHAKKIGHFRKGEGFVVEMEKIIAPRPDQKEQVHQILTRHSLWVKKYSEQQRIVISQSLDSLQSELALVLSDDQIARISEKLENIRKRPGPPPPPPPDRNSGVDKSTAN